MQAGGQLKTAIMSGAAFQNVEPLFRGVLILHADLKTQTYTYAFAFPFLKLAQPFQLLSCKPVATAVPQLTAAALSHLNTIRSPMLIKNLHKNCAEGASDALQLLPWGNLSDVSASAGGVWPQDLTVVALDTCSHDRVLGWPLRNICALLTAHFPGQVVEVLAVRMERGVVSAAQSLLLAVQLPAAVDMEQAAVAGWQSTVLDKVRSSFGAAVVLLPVTQP
jgi:hypothetical protein